MKKYLIT